MENNNGNDPNAGNPSVASPGDPGQGNQGGETTPESGNPQGQNGNAPMTDAEKIKILEQNIKGLNSALIKSRQEGRQRRSTPGGEEGNPFETEAGQYAAALELSDARLRGNMEERLAFYPELSADELQRIRLNPWAFASRQSFLTGDWETALDEIEEKIANRVDEIAANNSQQPQGQQNGATPQGGNPATVNANPAPEGEPEQAEPGTPGDQNLWTMPLPELEKLKNKAVAKMSQPQQ